MLIVKFLPILLAISATQAASVRLEGDSADVVHLSSPITEAQMRAKRSAFPGRAMMIHGYFGSEGHPYHSPVVPQHGYNRHNGRSYDPQRALTAFAAGDTVSAGSSYYGGGGGLQCRNCNGANKPGNGNGNAHSNGNGHPTNGNGHPANGNGNAHSNGNGHPTNGNGHPANGNGNTHSNGNGHPTNGNGFHQHTVPSHTPATNDKPVNGNGQQKPKGEEEVGYPNANGNGADNGGYPGEQPTAEETLPPAGPTRPTATEAPKKGPAAEESEEEEEDEEDESPFFSRGKGRGKGRGPSYNTYFPIMFGAYPGFGVGRGSNRQDENAYNPGVATAIANSFSTGRGAVATSHATAYGGPHFIPPSYRKNGSRGHPN